MTLLESITGEYKGIPITLQSTRRKKKYTAIIITEASVHYWFADSILAHAFTAQDGGRF